MELAMRSLKNFIKTLKSNYNLLGKLLIWLQRPFDACIGFILAAKMVWERSVKFSKFWKFVIFFCFGAHHKNELGMRKLVNFVGKLKEKR